MDVVLCIHLQESIPAAPQTPTPNGAELKIIAFNSVISKLICITPFFFLLSEIIPPMDKQVLGETLVPHPAGVCLMATKRKENPAVFSALSDLRSLQMCVAL